MDSRDMNTILQRLQGLRALSDLPMDEIAREDGLADKIVQNLRGTLRAAQLRKFYNLLKRIELDPDLRSQADNANFPPKFRPQVLRVLPLLAYARGRDNIPEDFYKVMKTVLDFSKIQKVQDYRTLIRLLEAMVAYHKFRGGRD